MSSSQCVWFLRSWLRGTKKRPAWSPGGNITHIQLGASRPPSSCAATLLFPPSLISLTLNRFPGRLQLYGALTERRLLHLPLLLFALDLRRAPSRPAPPPNSSITRSDSTGTRVLAHAPTGNPPLPVAGSSRLRGVARLGGVDSVASPRCPGATPAGSFVVTLCLICPLVCVSVLRLPGTEPYCTPSPPPPPPPPHVFPGELSATVTPRRPR